MSVGIVGGGLTGLALTHYLGERGVTGMTFEASGQVGGVVRSESRDGRVLERGPQRLRLSAPVRSLVAELGLEDRVLEADDDLPLYVYADGELRLAPFSLPAFLRTDLLSWRGKARVFAEPLTAPGSDDESAADLLGRKFGREAYENLAGPLFGGTFGSDPREMPARHSLSGLLALERRQGSLLKPVLKRALSNGDRPPAATFRDGLQTLPEALYRANEARVQLETPVETIHQDGDGYVLETDAGSVYEDDVVLTTPADVSADLLSAVAPDAADRLARLNYNPLALVYLVSPFDGEGFGYQVRHDEGLQTLGVSWNASMFDREGLYTCFLGGMRNPDLVGASDERLGRVAREEFEAVTGAEADVLDVTRLHRGFPAYDRSWDALDGLSLPGGITLATNYTARMGMPSRVREAKQLATELASE